MILFAYRATAQLSTHAESWVCKLQTERISLGIGKNQMLCRKKNLFMGTHLTTSKNSINETRVLVKVFRENLENLCKHLALK